MEVTIHSTLNTIQGRVVVSTDPAHTVDSLITAFCVDMGIPQRKHYVLRNKNLQVLANQKQLRNCGVENDEVLYLGVQDADEEWCCGCNQWWLIATVAMLIGCAGLAAITVLHIMQERTLYEYGVIIDAGSTHSQIFVYRWPGKKDDLTAKPNQILTNKTKPGISSYETHPSDAGKSLEKLVQAAIGAVPKDERANTAIYLGATGGMRLLNASDNATSDAIMNSTRAVLSRSGFDFTEPENQSVILAGRDEGAFSWVTANYASDVFKQHDPETLGALDLGGASTQITFIPSNASSDKTSSNATDRDTLVLYGDEYHVYTHSYLCYGVNEAERQYLAHLTVDQHCAKTILDPCRPSGASKEETHSYIFEAPCTKPMPANSCDSQKDNSFTFQGTSDPEKCAQAVRRIFNFNETCTKPPCTFDGVSMPPVYGKFLAFNGFFYPVRFLNLTKKPTFSLDKFEDTFTKFCNKSWKQVQVMPPYEGDLQMYCFEANLVHTILVDAYKFDHNTWNNIQFIQHVKDTELGWSLGYMLNASNSIPDRVPEQRISTVLFVLLVILFALFLGAAVGFACHAKNHRQNQSANDYRRMASYGSI